MAKYMKQRDTYPVITDQLLNQNSSAVNVSGCTVYFLARLTGASEYQVCASATIVTGSSGTVSYTASANDFPLSGTFEYEWEVHTASGYIFSVPTATYGTIYVYDDLGDGGLTSTHASGTINMSATSLDSAGVTLGAVPPGSSVFAYLGTQPVAVAVATSSGNFSLTLVDGLTYALKYRYPGFANSPSRTVTP